MPRDLRIDEAQLHKPTDPMISASAFQRAGGRHRDCCGGNAARYSRWSVPVLVLHGEKDTLIRSRQRRDSSRWSAAEDKRLRALSRRPP